MAREPLLLIMAFFTFFALAIVYVRLDFAITKDEGTEVKLKVAGFCEKVAGHQVKKSLFIMPNTMFLFKRNIYNMLTVDNMNEFGLYIGEATCKLRWP